MTETSLSQVRDKVAIICQFHKEVNHPMDTPFVTTSIHRCPNVMDVWATLGRRTDVAFGTIYSDKNHVPRYRSNPTADSEVRTCQRENNK